MRLAKIRLTLINKSDTQKKKEGHARQSISIVLISESHQNKKKTTGYFSLCGEPYKCCSAVKNTLLTEEYFLGQ